MSSFFRAALC